MGYDTKISGSVSSESMTDAQQRLIDARLSKLLGEEEEEFAWDRWGAGWVLSVDVCWKDYSGAEDAALRLPGFEKESFPGLFVAILRRIAVLFPDDARGEFILRGDEPEDLRRVEVQGKTIWASEAETLWGKRIPWRPDADQLAAADALLGKLSEAKKERKKERKGRRKR